jgi:hypothetical protein
MVRQLTDLEKAVFDLLDEKEGFAIEPGLFPKNILDRLVDLGLVETEIRLGIAVYWKKVR